MTINELWRFLPLALITAMPATGFADEAPDFSGAELYQIFCASCHGTQARGDGPVAKTLKTPPPDLTLISKRYSGQFPAAQIHRIVDGQTVVAAHGSHDMPVWGWQFYARDREDPERRQRADQLITRLVDYLRTIQR